MRHVNVKELQGVLERLENMYTAAGATGPAKDLKSVGRMLEGHGDKSIEEFVAETRALLASDAPDRGDSRPRDEVVDRHARRLLAAGTDQAEFEKALSALDKDEGAGKADWFAIANRYLNEPTRGTHTYRFRSAKEARSAIRDAFVERFEAGGKQGIIKKLTRWAS
jgi:hypothetical protein